jgi:hypothetical protein
MKAVVRPNFDTLYSSGWLDLTKEPVIVSVPDTDGRFYLLPMLDMWTDVFASPGWRATGTEAGNFLIVPPGWRPDLRDGVIKEFKLPENTQRIDVPTPYVWIIGRTKTDGPQDYDAVHRIQAGLRQFPLAARVVATEHLAQKKLFTVSTRRSSSIHTTRMFCVFGFEPLEADQDPSMSD